VPEVFKRDDNNIPVMGGVENDADEVTKQVRIDPTDKGVLVHIAGEDGIATNGSVGTFRKTVTSAGTAEQLASNACKRVVVQALSDNTSNAVEVGDANVVAAEATQRGVKIYKGNAFVFLVSNTNLLYVDVLSNGDGVSVYFEN